MEKDSSLSFRLWVYVFVVLVECMNAMILVNLGLDLKKGPKVHLVLLLGLSLHDSLVGLAFVPWNAHYNDPEPTLCTCLVFMLRQCLMGSVTFVTLLALERFLSMVAPFWYNLHVTVKRAIVTSILVPVATLLFNSASLIEDSIVEVHVISSNTSFTECQNIPNTSIALLIAVVSFANVTLHLVFNVTFIRKLHHLRRAADVFGGNDTRGERYEELALLRLVVALCVVSVVSLVPIGALAIWRYVHAQTASSGRLALSLLGGVGFATNPLVFLVCTARYRQRLRRCFVSAVRAMRNKCRLGAMLTSDTTESSRNPRSHTCTTEPSLTQDVTEMAAQSTADGQDASDAGPRTSGLTTIEAKGKPAGEYTSGVVQNSPCHVLT